MGDDSYQSYFESVKTKGGAEGEEAACGAFGYLRGLQERALAVRFLFRSGRSVCLPYGSLAAWEHHPSVGLLLKFTGDLVLLVLIGGSNFDAEIGTAAVNLIDRGFQRQRITWVREQDEDELRRAGEGDTTVSSIAIAAFASQEKLKEWVSEHAPAFLDGPLVAL